MEKRSKRIVRVIVLIILFAVLINSQWLFFLPESTRMAIAQKVALTFGSSGLEVDGFSLNLPKLITLAAVIVLLWLIQTAADFIIGNIKYKNNRSKTVANLMQSIIKYLIVIIGVIWGLSVLGVNTAAVFASLGVVSLIIGFGAQSLIEDIITGIFIIFEGQYSIGDVIILGDFRGTVTKIGVRTTSIEDAGGNVKIVNNSDIRNMQNRSLRPSVAICDVGISYSESIPRVEEVLKANMPKVQSKYPEYFLNVPRMVGVQEIGASSVVLRILADVKEDNIFMAQRMLNREVKLIFDENNIEIPFTQIVLHN